MKKSVSSTDGNLEGELDKFLDVLIDIIIDSFIASRQKRLQKSDKIEANSN